MTAGATFEFMKKYRKGEEKGWAPLYLRARELSSEASKT